MAKGPLGHSFSFTFPAPSSGSLLFTTMLFSAAIPSYYHHHHRRRRCRRRHHPHHHYYYYHYYYYNYYYYYYFYFFILTPVMLFLLAIYIFSLKLFCQLYLIPSPLAMSVLLCRNSNACEIQSSYEQSDSKIRTSDNLQSL